MRPSVSLTLLLLAACHPSPSAGALSGSGISTPGAMQGTVVDASTGSGVSGATVALIPGDTVTGAGSALSTRTVGGDFRFAAIIPGRYMVEVTARGYRPTSTALHSSPGQARSGYRFALVPVAVCPKPVVGQRNPTCP